MSCLALTSPLSASAPPVILPLAARPDLAPLVAHWIWDAFWREEGATAAEAAAFVASAMARQGLPQTFVLLLGGVPAGTASLVTNDLDARPDLTPWLASVWVEPWARGQGHAGALVCAVESAARALGIEVLWLYTRRAERIYLRAGWATVDNFPHLGSTAALMRRDLAASGAGREVQ